MLNIVGFIIQKVRKKTYSTVKSYTAPFYDKNISEVTVEDIQKPFDKKTEKKYYVTANDILMKLNPIFNKAIEWGLIDKILFRE
ncbi:hypothetical protein ACA350_02455 [Orientia tsutsugamushi]|uniref:hypothetical protein n=1 Tax=Orientia tsutsugamushi TaxID=784 RepID=UPI003526E676